MRIEQLTAAAYTVPTETPEEDGTLAWTSTTLVLVRAQAGGLEGLGWTYGPPACATLINETIAGQVVGGYVLEVGRAFQAMVRATRNASRPGLVGYAISAVDIALWDLKARQLQLPLHWLLGGVRDRVPVYGSGGFTNYDDATLRAQLTDWAERGIPRVKIKVGTGRGADLPRDIDRVALTRKVVGDDCAVFVDANGAYGRKQAIRAGHAFADHDVTWFEEPVSSDDLAGLAQVRSAVTADVAAGEYAWDVYYVRHLCAAEAVDCPQIDVTRCGGITEWLRAAAIAASFGLEISGHCAPNASLGVAAATTNFRHLEWFHDHVLIENRLFDGVADPSGGWIRPSDNEPGLGVRFRTQDAEQFRVR